MAEGGERGCSEIQSTRRPAKLRGGRNYFAMGPLDSGSPGLLNARMSLAERTKWDARYQADPPDFTPSAFLAALDGLLPRRGRALDVGGGAGRNALALARRGLDVTLVDVSPIGLALAHDEAIRTGNRLETLALDLDTDALPAGPWDLILQAHYLHRPLFQAYPVLLAPGGLLVVVHPTRRNLERHSKPGPEYLLGDGELPALVSGLEIVLFDEGWHDDGRHEARLVARRPAS
jgi:tellurite methyltransferase